MQPYVRGGPIVKFAPPAAPRMAGDAVSAQEPGFRQWLAGLLGGGGGKSPVPPAGGAGLGRFGLAGAAGVGIPIGLEVLSQLSREDNPGDPGGNLARNLGGGGGAIGGGLAGAALGAKLGSIVPGAGTLIGAGLGAMVGSGAAGGAGRALVGAGYDAFRGTPEDRATQQAIRSNEAMARSQLGLAQEALPLETQRMEMARQFEQQRMNEMVMARARDTYQQALLGAASVPAGAYADPSFMQALAMAGRIG
jgi:hypothetical protein